MFYIATLIKDTIMNNAKTTKVARKTIFSKPRLVNDEELPPILLAKPVPLDCMKIITMSVTPRII